MEKHNSARSGFLLAISFIILLLAAQSAQADLINYEGFHFLDAKQGLSDNIVPDMGQDDQGFMWFGTRRGLNRYDGYDIKVYNPASGTTSDVHLDIRCLLAARDKRIWLAIEQGGVLIFDPASEEFTDLALFFPDSTLSEDWKILDISEGPDGTIWLSSDGNGILRLDPPSKNNPLTGTWLRDLPLSGDRLRVIRASNTGTVWAGNQDGEIMVLDSLGGLDRIVGLPVELRERGLDLFDLFEARDGTLWASTDIGLFRHDRLTDEFVLIQPRPQSEMTTFNYLTGAAEDSSGILWIGSFEGLYRFDPSLDQFKLYPHNPADPGSPVRGPVIKIFCGTSGMVWASCWYSGIIKYDSNAMSFQIENANLQDPNSLAERSAQALFEDSDGTLWVGTGYRGPGNSRGILHRRAPDTTGYERWEFPDEKVTSVEAIIRDDDGRLWIGTNSGLWRFTIGGTQPLVRAQGEPGAKEVQVFALNIDKNGNLWVGTFGNGLFIRDRKTGNLLHHGSDPDDENSKYDNKIVAIQNDLQGRTWAGSDGGGLLLFNEATDSFQRFLMSDSHTNSILSIVPREDGVLFLGTYGGLVEFHPEKGVLRVFNNSSGLPNEAITQMALDDSGACWLSVSTGIVRVDLASGRILEFSDEDGLGEFGGCFTAIRRRSGTLLFGGPGGLLEFDPARLQSNEYHPPVVFTDVTVNGQSIRERPLSKLSTDMESTGRLELAHDQNDLVLSFSALDYTSSSGILYRHRLDGFDDRWSDPGPIRTAYYTNLDPGLYNLRVLASNSQGLWNTDEAQITIFIRKPWWTTWPALTVYFLIAVLLLFLAQRQQAAREIAKRNMALNRAKSRHLSQMSEVKSKFLVNVAREFQGPLTLIKSLVLHGENHDQEARNRSQAMMERNTTQLEILTNQLLALASLETGGVEINRSRGLTVELLDELALMYRAVAKKRGIQFNIHRTSDKGEGWMDFDLLESIFTNLLDNAIKSTEYRGTIEVWISLDRDVNRFLAPDENNTEVDDPGKQGFWLDIKVTNTNSPNTTGDPEKAFERFYTAAASELNQSRGSGIGLALVKEFALVLGGKVSAETSGENSTSYQVELPVFDSMAAMDLPDNQTRHVASAEIISGRVNKALRKTSSMPQELLSDDSDFTQGPHGQDSKTILVIDQDADMRSFLRSKLGEEFNIVEAIDGSTGLELITAELPDLVLCDERMGDMRGEELCDKIKHKWRTQNIPVVIFFTGDDEKSRLAAYEAGADDYIQKPFNFNEVRVRIINLIKQRDRVTGRHEDQQEQSTNPQTVGLLASEDEFMTSLNLIIEQNLHDPEFKIESLAGQLFMSRSTLHRKLLVLTGQTSSNYLRNRRLQRAAQLLSQSHHNVMEVSLAVGYKNPSNFSRAFREYFGASPSGFRKTGL